MQGPGVWKDPSEYRTPNDVAGTLTKGMDFAEGFYCGVTIDKPKKNRGAGVEERPGRQAMQ